MKRSRERKGEIGFEEKLCNPVFNFSKRKQGLRLKHLSTDLGENESARAVYPFRPSGWFQRGVPKMQQKTSLTPERNFGPSSGWNDFQGSSGLRIKRNLSLNWMVFRYARNGATPNAKFRGTHSQKSKTCDTRTKTNPTRERKCFYASNTSSKPLLTLN